MGADPARDLREDARTAFPTHLRGRTRKAAGRHASEVQQEGIPNVRPRGSHHIWRLIKLLWLLLVFYKCAIKDFCNFIWNLQCCHIFVIKRFIWRAMKKQFQILNRKSSSLHCTLSNATYHLKKIWPLKPVRNKSGYKRLQASNSPVNMFSDMNQHATATINWPTP